MCVCCYSLVGICMSTLLMVWNLDLWSTTHVYYVLLVFTFSPLYDSLFLLFLFSLSLSLSLLSPLSLFLSLFYSLVLSDFAAAAVLITFGSMLGRASPFQLFGIAILEVIFYSANNAINDHVFRAADVGGSMIIHSFGAYFGLACSIMLQRKKVIDHPRNSSVYHSDMFAMIGEIYWDLLKYTGIYDSACTTA